MDAKLFFEDDKGNLHDLSEEVDLTDYLTTDGEIDCNRIEPFEITFSGVISFCEWNGLKIPCRYTGMTGTSFSRE